jgi:hypothetical protein
MMPAMSLGTRARVGLAFVGIGVGEVACFDGLATGTVERQVQRSFTVTAGSTVHVRISGGAIASSGGEAGTVRVTLRQRISAGSDEEADRVLAEYEMALTQEGNDVRVLARPKGRGGSNRVHVSATLTAPPDARLDLETSGGGITVRGDRQASLRAATSGGGIDVDGGAGDLTLDTSGGGITVGRALAALSADTSGGGISVGYVGPAAREIELGTSGGGIQVGVDPAASLAVSAATSGGGVRIDGLPFTPQSQSGSSARGTINSGAGRLRAETSGGSIVVQAAAPPN